MITAPGDPAMILCISHKQVPMNISCRKRLSSLLNDATVPKNVPVQPRIVRIPSYVKAETRRAIQRKMVITTLEVEKRLVKNLKAATRPRQAAVQ
jgi:hypothetical protein